MANKLGIYERNGVFHLEANDSVAETDVGLQVEDAVALVDA